MYDGRWGSATSPEPRARVSAGSIGTRGARGRAGHREGKRLRAAARKVATRAGLWWVGAGSVNVWRLTVTERWDGGGQSPNRLPCTLGNVVVADSPWTEIPERPGYWHGRSRTVVYCTPSSVCVHASQTGRDLNDLT